MMDIEYWLKHFEKNAQNRTEPLWDAPLTLKGKPLQALVKSLEQFQLGDGGGPASLIGRDQGAWFQQNAPYKKLVDLWFEEEKEHARLLGEALKRFGGQELDSHWSFEIFCAVRKWLGVNFELDALLLTEIVSHVYYRMLYKYGEDVALKGMCKLIIKDEMGHIAFHKARLRASQRTFGRAWEGWFRLRGLAAGTMLWINHRSAVVALGGSTAEFYAAIWKGMTLFIRSVRQPKPRTRTAQKLFNASVVNPKGMDTSRVDTI